MPHLGKLVRLFDFLISMEMSDQCPSRKRVAVFLASRNRHPVR